MAKANQYKNYIFWTIIILLMAVVITVTAGTYFQYKMDITQEPETKESLGMAYQVLSNTKSVWFLVGSFFH